MAQDPFEVDLTPPINERDHAQGREDAPLTLVQYGDYECPYTRNSLPIVQGLQQQLGARLRFVYRHFPLVEIHPHALRAAEAQGHFWPMLASLFAHQHELEDGQLGDHARTVGLDTELFARDMSVHSHLERIRADLEGGAAGGGLGTPTFFVNGAHHEGSYDREALLAALTGEDE
jgi:protein-disulfide isomerase